MSHPSKPPHEDMHAIIVALCDRLREDLAKLDAQRAQLLAQLYGADIMLQLHKHFIKTQRKRGIVWLRLCDDGSIKIDEHDEDEDEPEITTTPAPPVTVAHESAPKTPPVKKKRPRHLVVTPKKKPLVFETIVAAARCSRQTRGGVYQALRKVLPRITKAAVQSWLFYSEQLGLIKVYGKRVTVHHNVEVNLHNLREGGWVHLPGVRPVYSTSVSSSPEPQDEPTARPQEEEVIEVQESAITVSEAAKHARVSTFLIRKRVKDGTLRSQAIKGRLHIVTASLDAAMKRNLLVKNMGAGVVTRRRLADEKDLLQDRA